MRVIADLLNVHRVRRHRRPARPGGRPTPRDGDYSMEFDGGRLFESVFGRLPITIASDLQDSVALAWRLDLFERRPRTLLVAGIGVDDAGHREAPVVGRGRPQRAGGGAVA